jgi:hypothetical protein
MSYEVWVRNIEQIFCRCLFLSGFINFSELILKLYP